MKNVLSFFLCAIITISAHTNSELFADLQITCSNDTSLMVDEASCGKIYFHNQPEVISSDGPVSFTLVSGLTTGSIFPVGEMLQTWQGEDSLGNVVLCSYVVSVIDDIAPEIQCPTDQVLPIMTQCISTLPNYLIDVEYSDNCSDNLNLIQTPEPGSLIEASTIVLLDISDQYGNVNTCAFYAMPEQMDNSITVDGSTLTSNFDGAIYQWVDCSGPKPLPIAGEVAQNFTASQSGSYALLVTQGTCTVQSDCIEVIISGLFEIEEGSSFDVFPNPSSGLITLALKEEIKGLVNVVIRNVLGQTIAEFEMYSNRAFTYDLSHLPIGNYLITATGSMDTYNKRIILQ